MSLPRKEGSTFIQKKQPLVLKKQQINFATKLKPKPKEVVEAPFAV